MPTAIHASPVSPFHAGLLDPGGRELSFPGYRRAEARALEVAAGFDTEEGRGAIVLSFREKLAFPAPRRGTVVAGFGLFSEPAGGWLLAVGRLDAAFECVGQPPAFGPHDLVVSMVCPDNPLVQGVPSLAPSRAPALIGSPEMPRWPH